MKPSVLQLNPILIPAINDQLGRIETLVMAAVDR